MHDDVLDEFFDLVMSKKPSADVWKDPEIVDFLQAKNLPPIDIDVGNITIPQDIKSFEEGFRYGLKRGFFVQEMERYERQIRATRHALNF